LSETVLGFDVGARRIGVAVGNDLLRQARAAAIVDAGVADLGHEAIGRLVREWQPERFVVGVPLPVDDDADDAVDNVASDAVDAGAKAAATTPRPSPALVRCERFARWLGERFGIPVERVDERYSSIDADTVHRERRGAGLARRAKRLDDVAAEVILQRWFDNLPPT
jgi:putative Holliday junction resolvase